MNFMNWVKKYKDLLKYRCFLRWQRRQYKKRLKDFNFEWDSVSIVDFMIFKLTMMGLYYAKYGICVDHKKQTHQIWETRKYFKNYRDAEDWAEEQCQRKFRKQFGCDFELKMEFVETGTKDHKGRPLYTAVFSCQSDVPDKQLALEVWDSYKWHDVSYQRMKASKKKAFQNMEKYLENWWD